MSRFTCTATGRTAATARWVVPALALASLAAALAAVLAAGWWPVSLDHRVAAALPEEQASGLTSVLLQLASAITTLTAPHATVLITLAAASSLARHQPGCPEQC